MKPLTKTMDALVRRLARHDDGRISLYGWPDDDDHGGENINLTTGTIVGVMERGLLTPNRTLPDGTQYRHELTAEGLAYAVEREWITAERAAELEPMLRQQQQAPTDDPDEDEGAFGTPVRTHGDGSQEYGPYATGGVVPPVKPADFSIRRGGIQFPRIVSSDAIVVRPAEGTDPTRPLDRDGREIRPGYVVTSPSDPEPATVVRWGLYSGGEEGWSWLVVTSRPGEVERHWAAHILTVVEPPAEAPEHGTTDELLHLLREAVSGGRDIHPSVLSGEDFATVLRLFDELDYRMSHPGYALPSDWTDAR